MTGKNIVQGIHPLRPLPVGTAGQQIFQALLKYRHLPDAVINVQTGTSSSFAQILDKSVNLALALQQRGYGKNNVLAICSENSEFYFYPLLAGLYLGIAVAPISQDYIKDELHHAFGLSKANLVFCSAKTADKVVELKRTISCIERIIVLDSDQSGEDVEALQDFMLNNASVSDFKPLDFDREEQIAMIFCSSGTTGLPKGVALTHKNIISRLAMTRDERFAYTMGINKTTTCVIPMSHAAGFAIVLHQLAQGYKLILFDKFNPDLYLKSIQDYQIDTIFAVPAMIGFLANSPLVAKYDISCLKLIVCSTAPLLSKIEEAALRRMPHLKGIAQAYGLTETAAGVLMPVKGVYKRGSSGKLLPLLSAKIEGIAKREVLGPNEEGELCIKGAVVMKGYINSEPGLEDGFDEDGWLHTGDLAYYDEEEFFYIVDRLKELIKYKGFQVPPAELEMLLLQHPDIQDAGVIGIPDERADELPMAFVVKLPGTTVTEKDIVDFIEGKVSDPKRLRGGVHFVDQLPRNQNGKLLRRVLQQSARELKN